MLVAGYLLAGLGAALGITGAYLTSSFGAHNRRLGFALWVINSPMLILYYLGVAVGWFDPTPLLIILAMQSVYWFTACRGFMNNSLGDPL